MADAMDVDSDSSLSSLSDPEDAPTPAAPVDAPTPSASFRRRSTRVVKKPETFTVAPTPASSRRGKRKRTVESDAEDDGDASSDTARGESKEADGGEEEEGDENDEEDDEDEDDEEEEDEDESSEGEPDEEELKERRRRAAKSSRGGGRGGRGGARGAAKAAKSAATPRKPATKKVKTDAEPKEKAPPKKRGRKPGPKRTQPAANGDGPHMVNEIYDAVFENGDDLDETASDWIEKYQQNRSDALKEMINFVLKCCGCEIGVTNFDIEDQDSATNTLSNIQEEFQEHPNADYPLMSKKPTFRKFRVHLNAFVAALIRAVSDKDLFITDVSLLDSLRVWIASMSSSTLRQFRHTATVIALDMCSCLCGVAAEVRKTNATTNRQLEAEENKAHKNEARIQQLRDKSEQGEQRREAVEKIINDMYETVFVHRYRDIDSKIRCECLHELGNWILALPDVFFDGSYLRYFGWMLSDTVPAVRIEVVKALTKQFKRQNVANLRHFTERFGERLVEMGTRDADHSVRTATVELLDEVRKAGFMEPSDIQTVGRLLFDTDQNVRKAVRPFVVETINDLYQEKLEDLGGEEAIQEALGDEESEEYDGPTTSWIKIKSVLEALSSYDEEDQDTNGDGESPRPFVERNRALISKLREVASRSSLAMAVLYLPVEEIQDWEAIAKYLLYDHSLTESDDDAVLTRVKQAVALDSKEEPLLLEMLVTSVTGAINRPKLKNKQQIPTPRDIEQARESLSRGLIPYIPRLLKKFGPVPEGASSVLHIIRELNLDVFSDLRQTSVFSNLLDEISRQFLTHSHDLVLKSVASVLAKARQSSSDLEDLISDKMGKLKDTLVSNLASAVRGKDIRRGKFSDKALSEIVNTAKRFEYLSAIMDNSELLDTAPPPQSTKDKPLTPFQIFTELTYRDRTGNELDEALVPRALQTIVLYFMWSLRNINANTDLDSDDPVFNTLIMRRAAVMNNLSRILTAEGLNPTGTIAISAATAILDLSTLFLVARESTPLFTAPSTISVPVQDAISNILDHVEFAFARASGRRAEVAVDAAPIDVSDSEESESEPVSDDDDDNDDSDAEEARHRRRQQRSAANAQKKKKPKLPPAEQVVLEQSLCELAAKLVVAILGGTVEHKRWRKRLARNQQNLGPNYKEVINHLDRNLAGRPGTRRTGVVPATAGKKQGEEAGKEAEKGKDAGAAAGGEHDEEHEDHEEEEEEQEEEEEEHHDEQQEEEEEHNADEEDRESEPDPEVPLRSGDDDGDEEMADA